MSARQIALQSTTSSHGGFYCRFRSLGSWNQEPLFCLMRRSRLNESARSGIEIDLGILQGARGVELLEVVDQSGLLHGAEQFVRDFGLFLLSPCGQMSVPELRYEVVAFALEDSVRQ